MSFFTWCVHGDVLLGSKGGKARTEWDANGGLELCECHDVTGPKALCERLLRF